MTIQVDRRLVGIVAFVALGALVHAQQGSKPAAPPPTGIAVVDVQKVLTQVPAGKAAYERLKTLQDQKIAAAKVIDAEVKKIEAAIEKGKATLPAAELARLQSQLADKRIQLQRHGADADREIGEARTRELAQLEEQVKPIIDAVAKDAGLAVIFNKFEAGLVYASDAIDVTDAVIRRWK